MNNKYKRQLLSHTIQSKNLIIESLKLYLIAKESITFSCQKDFENKRNFSFEQISKNIKLNKLKSEKSINDISYNEIQKYGSHLISNTLIDSIFIMNISIFEDWIMNILKTRYTFHKLSYPDKNISEYSEDDNYSILKLVKDSENIDDLWGKIISRQLLKFGYKNLRNQMLFLIESLNVGKNTIPKKIISFIYETSLVRNLIIHNKKKVNGLYLELSNNPLDCKIGNVINISTEYLFEQSDNLLKFMVSIQKEKFE